MPVTAPSEEQHQRFHTAGEIFVIVIVVIQLLSHAQLFVTPYCSMPGSPVLHYLQEFAYFMPFELVMLFNHFILCDPLLLLPSIFPSIRIFSNESALCIRWPKYWSFRISPFNEYSGFIFFRVDWFDILAVHGTLKNLHQHYNSKASILRCSVFLMVQLSYPSIHD